DGSKDLEADWVNKKCGNFNTKTGSCGGSSRRGAAWRRACSLPRSRDRSLPSEDPLTLAKEAHGMDRFVCLVLLACSLILASPAPRPLAASQDDLAAGLALIAKDNFNDTAAGIDTLARSGAAHVAAVLE